MADRRWTWILIVGAVVVRAALVLGLRTHEVPRSTYEHGEIAENMLAGRGFAVKFLGADGPTSQQAPVYPAIVAAAYAIGGGPTPRSLLILELGQAVLGGWLVAVVMALTREAAPEGHGKVASRLAGIVVAFHPTLAYAATHVQVAALAALLLALTLQQGFKAARTGRAADAARAGFALGLLILTDPILGLAFLGVVWAILQDRAFAMSLRWKNAGIAGLVAVVVLTPWTIRNYRVHGEFVAVKSTFGYAFWQGNCALSEGTDKVVRRSVERALAQSGTSLRSWNDSIWKARHEAGYLDDIALTKADRQALGRVSEPERSRVLFRRALADLKADPSRYWALCLRRLRYFLLFDETNPKTRNLVYRTSELTLTAFAAVGLFVMPTPWRKRLGPTLVTASAILLFHSLTIISARFRIPVEPLLALWGAAMFDRIWRRRSMSVQINRPRLLTTAADAQQRLAATS